MSITAKEIADIIIPGVAFSPSLFIGINPKWLEWAGTEIESGKNLGEPPDIVTGDPKYMLHYLRILRIVSIFYEHKNNIGVPWKIFDEIAKRAFDYCEIDRLGYPFLYLGKRMAETQGLIESAKKVTPVEKLTPKGMRELLNAIGDVEPPSIVSPVLQEDAEAFRLAEDDIWEILDPNNALPPMEVSDEWYDWGKVEFETAFAVDTVNYDETRLSVALLRCLRVAIDYYEYHRVVYEHQKPLGGIYQDDFEIIAQTLFNAANIGQFLTTTFSSINHGQYIRHIHVANRPLFGTVGSPVPVYALNLSIQGRRYLRQQLGALDDPPRIEPDEFEDYNPYDDVVDEHNGLYTKDDLERTDGFDVPEEAAPQSKTKNENSDKPKSEFQRNFARLIEGSIGRQYDDEGNMIKATVDGKAIVFQSSPLGKVAKVIFKGITGDEAFTREDIELALDEARLGKSSAKKVIEIMEAAIIKAKCGQLSKGPDKPKAFIHDPGRSQPGRQQYITKLAFEQA